MVESLSEVLLQSNIADHDLSPASTVGPWEGFGGFFRTLDVLLGEQAIPVLRVV
jgi:hypothetical protein